MIKSMTGYGRASGLCSGYDMTVEIKSVNHRFIDLQVHCPRGMLYLEPAARELIRSRVIRGKIECFICVNRTRSDSSEVLLDKPLADGYKRALDELCTLYDLTPDNTVWALASHQDIFAVRETDTDVERIVSDFSQILGRALDSFDAMREREGEHLRDDVLSSCSRIESAVAFIEERYPAVVEEYTKRLRDRIAAVLEDKNVDEARILTEAAIFADKTAVAEETVRLRSHIDQMRRTLDSSGDIGKSLDFLVQEMNREANTTGSKSQDIEVTRRVLAIKNEIEKIREQIQNIE